MFYFDLKSDAVYLTVCQGKTRNKASRMCVSYLLTFQKIYIRCLGYKICLTKNSPCRYEVFHGHRRRH